MSEWKLCPSCGSANRADWAMKERSGKCSVAGCNTQVFPVHKSSVKRPSWDNYFFDLARLVSTRATCPRASIGVVLVSKDHRVISTGFNGAPAGAEHCTDVGCDIFADHCVRATHAEVNAVEGAWQYLASRTELDEAEDYSDFLARLAPVAYVVGPRPICSHCARTLSMAGVKEVKWKSE